MSQLSVGGILMSRKKKIVPGIDDRKFWETLQKSERFKPIAERLLKDTIKSESADISPLKASWFLQFERTGNRSFFEERVFKRRKLFSNLVLSECIENKGRFLNPITDYIWAICEESTWTLPAHEESAHSYGKGLPDIEKPTVALFSGATAMELAITHYILGEKIHAMCRTRIEHEAKRRIIEPFLTRDFGWMKNKNNWNPVCNNSVLWSAILLLNDKQKVSRIINRVLKNLSLYIGGFDADGGTSEGINYWNYGFSRYIMAAHILEKYTNGEINLFNDPLLKKIARFPMYVELSPSYFINFADASSHTNIDQSLLLFLSKKLRIQELSIFAEHFGQSLSLLNLYQINETLKIRARTSRRSLYKKSFYFRGMEWLISRKNTEDKTGLVFAAKCGNNGEMHNHNDVGSFILHYKGETFISDAGAPVYTKQTFSERRYELFPCSSACHSVPVINRIFQSPGIKYEGRVLKHRDGTKQDIFKMDIGKAYPENSGLTHLIRTFIFDREGKGQLNLKDEFLFKKSSSIQEVFITFLDVKKSDRGYIVIQGRIGNLKIKCEQKDVDIKIEKISTKKIGIREHFTLAGKKERCINRIIFTPVGKNRRFSFDFQFIPL
jgi:hypothetical protein